MTELSADKCCQLEKNQHKVLIGMGTDLTHVICIICEKEWVE